MPQQLIPVEHDPFDLSGRLAQPDRIVPPPVNPLAPPAFLPDAAVDALKSVPRGLLAGQEMFIPPALTDRDRHRLGDNRAAQLDQAHASSRSLYDDLRNSTHEPATTAGRYAETLASVAGNPLNWVGPGSLPFKAAWNFASGLGSETAGQAYEGTPWEKAARVLGGWSPMAAERAIALAPRLPQGNVGVFGGKMAVTADHQALNRAQALAKAGTDPSQIWRDTGWFQGADKKWRFEIDDSKAAFAPSGGSRLGDTLDHPELFAAYPSLAKVNTAPMPEKSSALASYTPPLTRFGNGKVEYPPGGEDQTAALLHELQHAVQNKEGFSSGSSRVAELPLSFGLPFKSKESLSRDFTAAGDRYRRNAGEVEARNVEARQDFSPSQRRELSPVETMDIPLSDQRVNTAHDSWPRTIARFALPTTGAALSIHQMADAVAELKAKRKLVPVDHDPFAP